MQRALVHFVDVPGEGAGELFGFRCCADDRAERANHVEYAGDVALIEGMHGDILADQFGDDVGLQVGKGEHQIRLQIENLRHIGRNKSRDARFLAPHLRRPHGITGHADNAVIFTEQIKGLDRFFGQADDSFRRKHSSGKHIGPHAVE